MCEQRLPTACSSFGKEEIPIESNPTFLRVLYCCCHSFPPPPKVKITPHNSKTTRKSSCLIVLAPHAASPKVAKSWQQTFGSARFKRSPPKGRHGKKDPVKG